MIVPLIQCHRQLHARRHTFLIGLAVLVTALTGSWPIANTAAVYAQSSCRINPLSLPASVSDALTDGDCTAPHNPRSKADLYTFEADVNSQVVISMFGSSTLKEDVLVVAPDGTTYRSADHFSLGSQTAVLRLRTPDPILLDRTGAFLARDENRFSNRSEVVLRLPRRS